MADIKIIHSADWHLGQTFFGYDRMAEHALFLQWLKEQVKTFEVDLLIVAGDIFDSPNPSAESQKMYYTFLCDITAENPRLQIIIIAGNHDSAARLEAPNPLLENLNITVRGVVKRDASAEIDYNHLIIPINKGGYCLAVPYLRQGDYPESKTYAEGVQKMYQTLFQQVKDKNELIIAMGHLQVTGSEVSEFDRSERTVIGGLECVSPEAFSTDIAYTALGHLHRGQRVSGRENVRYAGSPLPFSFAEKNNKQGVILVNITDRTEIEHLEFEKPVKLLTLPQKPLPLSEVLDAIGSLPDGKISDNSPYLELKVLISEPEPSLKHQIETALEGKAVRLARIALQTPTQNRESQTISYEQLQTINPMDMAIDIFKRKYATADMPQNMKSLLKGVIEEIER